MCKRLLIAALSLIPLFSSPASASEIDIHIANRGEIPVYVAVASWRGLLSSRSTVEGWYKINPHSYLEPRVVWGSSYDTYFLTFAIKDQFGNFGITDYAPGRSSSYIDKGFVGYYAVDPTDNFKYKGRADRLRKNSSNRVVVPFNFAVETNGHNRNHTVEIKVVPKRTDRLSKILVRAKPKPKLKPKLLPQLKKYPYPSGQIDRYLQSKIPVVGKAIVPSTEIPGIETMDKSFQEAWRCRNLSIPTSRTYNLIAAKREAENCNKFIKAINFKCSALAVGLLNQPFYCIYWKSVPLISK